MARTSINTREWANAGFQNFAKEEFVSAPFTQIVNRAQVSNSLKPMMGVERIEFKGLTILPKEFGANGETVSEISEKDSRIRFVGTWTYFADSNGGYVANGTAGTDFIEITFYGTGLNLLARPFASADWRATVDGGAEDGSSFNPSHSTVLAGRNYSPRTVIPVKSGLSAGLHTVKIRYVSGSNGFVGIEILNERANVLFPAGSAFNGMNKESLLTAATSTYNSSITGTKGGRVVKYIKNGAIGEAVQMVDASQATFASTNHANEEQVRKINFREFGANRGDDFSTLSTASNRAFTLDDGTTTLVGSDVISGYSGLREGVAFNSATGSFITITFVGTGLDFIEGRGAATLGSMTQQIQVFVDGTSIGNATGASYGWLGGATCKVVSGLPYGTHTVKFLATAGGNIPNMSDFIIYSPKKPAIPAGAVELADYNVMADFVANATVGLENIATGVLRKPCVREITYVGSWSITSINPVDPQGFETQTSTASDYWEYTFFGTGFDYRFVVSSGRPASTLVKLNGTDLNASFPGASGVTVSTYGTGVQFGGQAANSTYLLSAVASNVLDMNDGSTQRPCGFRASGLPLGKYTIRVTNNSGGSSLGVECFDIITPIHINNTKVGSLSLKDSRNTSPAEIAPKGVDLSKAKAWCIYDKANNRVLASHNIAAVVNISTGTFIVYFSKPFKNTNYICVMSGANYENYVYGPGSTKSTNHQQLATLNSGGASVDSVSNAVFFGELENEENS